MLLPQTAELCSFRLVSVSQLMCFASSESMSSISGMWSHAKASCLLIVHGGDGALKAIW